MSPPVGASILRRSFGMLENYPLYLMVGIAAGLSVYTPIRHLLTAGDVAIDRQNRDYMDGLASSSRVREVTRHYEGGILGAIAAVHNWPQVWPLPKDVDPASHFHHERWPAPRPTAVPQPKE